MRSLDQRRAAAAYLHIATAESGVLDLARRLPDMLRTNGLLATWAFLLVKERKTPRQTPLPALVAHLRSLPALDIPPSGDLEKVFLHWVGGSAGASGGIDGPALRALTAEALAFAGWLKRAAEARGDSNVQGEEAADAAT